MAVHSVFQIYSKVFQFGKLIGIYPEALNFPYAAQKKNTPNDCWPMCIFFKSIWVIIRSLLIGYSALHFTFLISQGIFAVYDLGEGTVRNMLEALGWIFASLIPLTIFSVNRMKSAGIQRVLDDLHELETYLIQKYMGEPGREEERSQRLRSELRFFRVTMFFEVIWSLLVPMMVVINGVYHPRLRGYIYSLVDEDVEIPWLKTLSIAIQTGYVYCGSVVRSHSQMYHLYLTRTTTLCADLLSSIERGKASPSNITNGIHDGNQNVGLEQKSQDNSDGLVAFEDAVKENRRLRGILESINEVHAWSLFFFKGMTLIFSTMMLYYPTRNAKPKVGQFEYMICYSVVFGVLGRMFILLYSMGQFYSASERFKRRWKTYLAWNRLLSDRNTARLKSCAAFGFESGDFYTVKPSTILTFYSILLSYIIFAFQI